MSVGGVLVAKKQPPKKGEDKAPRKSPDSERRRTLFAIKGRDSWKRWVEELAEFDRLSAVDLIDRALVSYARSIGFTKAPPER